MSEKIGSQHGITAYAEWLREQPNAPQRGPSYDPDDLATWPWPDKIERTLSILAADHDAAISNPDPVPPDPVPPDPPPENGDLWMARGRIFLAQAPLDCLAAPEWMTPVCTADRGYRDWYTPDVIGQLRARFGFVEAWCDCRNPTAYSVAVEMVQELGLDGAWGQCETTAEFDHAYASGACRMVGSCNAEVLDDERLARVASGEVLLSVELYRNVQPSMLPDWRGANNGIGGNCIACYGSETEGAVYTPVAAYREAGLYTPHYDSVYGVGLTDQDWRDLA